MSRDPGGPAILDTSVVVAGLLTRTADAPTSRLLDGMLDGRYPFLVSVDLLAEVRRVLLRPRIRARHGLGPDEIDRILLPVAEHAIVVEPRTSEARAPDAGDQHLWDLLAARPGAFLATGDRALLGHRRKGRIVVRPAEALELLGL